MPADITLSGSMPIAVNYAFASAYVNTANTVLFTTSASGIGHDADPSSGAGAIAAIVSTGSGITVSHGTYKGGAGHVSDADQPQPAILSQSDASLTITGGTADGGTPGPSSGCPGVVILDPGGGSITGGTITGSAAGAGSGLNGCTALIVCLRSGDFMISGGSSVGGAGDGSGTQGYSLGFGIAGSRTLVVSGGSWSGAWVGTIEAGSRISVLTTIGIVPTRPDGSAFTATVVGLYTNYT